MTSYQFKALSLNAVYISGEAGIINIIFLGVCLLFIFNRLTNRLKNEIKN